MDLAHEFTVPASLDETWAAFDDIASVGECFPGAQVTEVDGDTFKGTVKVKLGPIALVYNGTGTFLEKDEAAHRMLIDAKGKDKRGNGTAGAHVTATMTDAGDGRTRVEVLTDLNITGKPAQFGRGVIQDVSDKLLGQFTACLEQKVGAHEEPAADEGPAAESRMHNMRSDLADEGSVAAATAPPGGDAPVGSPASGGAASGGAASGGAAPRDITSAGSRRPAPSSAPSSAPTAGNDDALDLGATVLPVLLKGYWREALIAVLGIALVSRVLRRH